MSQKNEQQFYFNTNSDLSQVHQQILLPYLACRMSMFLNDDAKSQMVNECLNTLYGYIVSDLTIIQQQQPLTIQNVRENVFFLRSNLQACKFWQRFYTNNDSIIFVCPPVNNCPSCNCLLHSHRVRKAQCFTSQGVKTIIELQRRCRNDHCKIKSLEINYNFYTQGTKKIYWSYNKSGFLRFAADSIS